MAVRQNKNKWMADLMLDRIRYRKHFDTPEEAQVFEAELRKRNKLGEPIDALIETKDSSPTATYGDMSDKTFTRYWANSKNEDQCISNMKILEEFFGAETPIKDITVHRIDDLIGHLQSLNRAPATINSKLASLSKIIRFAHERGYLETKPRIERVTQPSNERLVFFDYDVEADIIGYLGDHNPDFCDWFLFAIDTGIRPGEIQALTKKCFRRDPVLGLVVDVREFKNTAGTTEARTIPLTDRAVSAVRRQMRDTDYPFRTWTEDARRIVWKKVRKNVDMDPELVPYCCRHTTATRLVQQGVSIKAVQQWMGHKDLQTTLRYVKLVPTDLIFGKNALEKPQQERVV